ncbi:MAG: tetratricopeptide repeat protein [Fibrobacterota bacterium]
MKRISALALPLLLLSGGCVYFNTLFNAKQYYNEARNSQKERYFGAEGDDSVKTITAKEKELFARSIKKSSKVLDVYSKKIKFQDDALFYLGMAFFYSGEYTKSARKYLELMQIFPESEYIPQSRYFCGLSYLRLGKLDDAEEHFLKILQNPNGEWASRSAYQMAVIFIERGSNLTAMDYLSNLEKYSKVKVLKEHAWFKMGELYYKKSAYDSAAVYFKKIGKIGRIRPIEGIMVMRELEYSAAKYYGLSLLASSKTESALKQFEKMAKRNLFSSHYSEIMLLKGRTLAKMEKFEEASRVFRQVTEEEDKTEFGAEAFYRLGKIFEDKKGLLDSARHYYKKSREHYSDFVFEEGVEEKIAGIEMLRSLQHMLASPVPASDTSEKTQKDDAADALDSSGIDYSKYIARFRDVPDPSKKYMMSEIYLMNLDMPDSAVSVIDDLLDTAQEDIPREKLLFAKAQILTRHMNDSATGEKLFIKIINDFPDTEFAKSSQRELGIPITAKTREDTVKEMMSQAEELFFTEGLHDSAASIYKKTAGEYPESPLAAKALYAAAYIYENHAGKNEKAADCYKEINDNYKESEYSAVARKRLQGRLDAELKEDAPSSPSKEENASGKSDG